MPKWAYHVSFAFYLRLNIKKYKYEFALNEYGSNRFIDRIRTFLKYSIYSNFCISDIGNFFFRIPFKYYFFH